MCGKTLAQLLILRRSLAAVVLIISVLAHSQSKADGTPPNPPRFLRIDSGRDFVPPFMPRPRPISSPTGGFPAITHAAGIIFSGTVTSILRVPDAGTQQAQTIAITFRVEQGIRGATSGQSLTISQWMGAWTAGQRYRHGDHVLLFLYPPSKLGLTSVIGSSMGRFAVDALGNVTLTAEHQAAFKSDPILAGKSKLSVIDFQRAVLIEGGAE